MPSTSPASVRSFAAILRGFLWLLVFLGTVFGVRSAINRYNVERANRRVEIVVDFAELRTLAAAEGVPLPQVLQQFRDAGVSSVAVQEETISGLQESKRLDFVPVGASNQETELRPTTHPDPATLPAADVGDVKETYRAPVLERVTGVLQHKTHFGVVTAASEGIGIVRINQPWALVRSVGVGLEPETIALIRGAGLGVVGRIGNWSGITPEGLQWTLAELKKQGVSTLIFSGDEVLGYKGHIAEDREQPGKPSTASALNDLGMNYGAVEFGKQKGDVELSKAATANTVRVHTITGAEMVTATLPEAVQRFALAARERNIRVLFVRLFLDEADPLPFNTGYVAKIVRGLQRGKLDTGIAHGYGPLGVGMIPRLLIGIGVGAALLLLLDAITGFLAGGIPIPLVLLFWAAAGAVAGLAGAPAAIGPKLAALAAALIFPSLGLLRDDLLAPVGNRRNAFGNTLLRFLFASFVTALGIAAVVGLLADRRFLVKADAFVGIKATLAVPVLLVALVYALDLRARPGRPFAQALEDTTDRLAALFRQPVLIWQIVAGVLALGLIFVILARSGNESGVGVSGMELKLRSLLDRFLFARPRFKDMLGHPALILALLVALRTGRRDWALPLFILGIFGQVSLLNTFCHLHTPLPVSLWRAFLGMGIGIVIGSAAYLLLDRFLLRRLPAHLFAPSGPGATP